MNLAEDLKIHDLIKSRYNLATICRTEIERDRGGNLKIKIYTPRPGVVIGRKGEGAKKLKAFLDKTLGKKVNLEILEVEKPDLDPVFVAENIAFQLQRRVSYKKAIKTAIARAMQAGAEGIKIRVSGRLAGVEIARSEYFMEGKVPTQNLQKDIRYHQATAITKYGTIGVKVWINLGDIKQGG